MRRSERIALEQTTRLHPNSWSSLEVQLLDVSDTGFRAECEARVIVGVGVAIDLPGLGTVDAKVTWRRGAQFGAQFILPIDSSACTLNRREPEKVLSRLLVERAAARQSGRVRDEQEIRRRILGTLPMRRGEAAAS